LPLSEKARIEVYVPDREQPNYQNLLDAFAAEFNEAFGGCTVQRGFEGRYLSDDNEKIVESMNVVYTDLPLELSKYLVEISEYLEEVKKAAHEILNEESILVTVRTVYHAE
jgi:hypothetical protein